MPKILVSFSHKMCAEKRLLYSECRTTILARTVFPPNSEEEEIRFKLQEKCLADSPAEPSFCQVRSKIIEAQDMYLYFDYFPFKRGGWGFSDT